MTTASSLVFDFAQVKREVIAALRVEFPQDTIAVSEGWHGRAHVKIVSERFNGRSEMEKQQIVWDILRAALGPEAQAVSLVLAYGVDEL
jgi:stress-induced morphogen